MALTVAGLLTRDGGTLGINYLIPIDDAFKYLNLDDALNQNEILRKTNVLFERFPQSTDTMPHQVYAT